VRVTDLTLPLDYEYMPDEYLPVSSSFQMAPFEHAEKGMLMGSEAGTCLTLPSQFREFMDGPRLDQLPPSALVMRPATLLSTQTAAGQELSPEAVDTAWHEAAPSQGDAVLLRTGWGDRNDWERPRRDYLTGGPHFTAESARSLAARMQAIGSDLLLTDMALIAWPDKHLLPEWLSLIPLPKPFPSAEARTYLHTYGPEKLQADFAIAHLFAAAGIMTVKRLINCAAITTVRFQVVVAPLQVVRGVAATCRVAAVEEAS